MGRLHRLEIENFKSYGGRQTVGPFDNFTAVIGPNGAGKSNLMDAISFVLGIRARDLRGHELRDLVYRSPEEAEVEDLRRRAAVTLVYVVGEGEEEASGGLAAGAELVFARVISPAGAGSYRLQGREVSFDEYDARLRGIGLLVKARNFLVFQGGVEAIAAKSPAELTEMFEEVSGSAELREQYEELRAAKEAAEENILFSMQKRKGVAAERKRIREQKAEAERFQETLEEQRRLRVELALWELFHADKGIASCEEQAAALQGTVDELQGNEARVDADVKESKRTHAKRAREHNALQKKLRAARDGVDEGQPRLIKLRAAVEHATKRRSADMASEEKIAADLERQREEQEGLEADVASIEEALEGLTGGGLSQQQSQQSQDELLGSQEIDRYEELKQQARVKAGPLQEELDGVLREQENDAQNLARLEASQTELRAEEQRLEGLVGELEARHDKLDAYVQSTDAEIAEAEAQLGELVAAHGESEQRRDAVTGELEEANRALRSLKDDRRQDRRQQKHKEVIEALKRQFPGVRGRLVDLARPVQSMFNVAATMAAGQHMDAIVVNDQATARACIAYLREQRVGVFSFIPLQGIRAKPIKERLRTLGSAYRLAFDLLECAEDVKPAVLFAVGNTVVCDSLDDARRLCFGRNGERVKAVTLAGDVISKAGAMTGGTTAGDAERAAGRWNESELSAAKLARDALQRELADLNRALSSSGSARLTDTRTKVDGLRTRRTYAVSDRKLTAEKLADQRARLAGVAGQLKALQPEAAAAQAAIDSRLVRQQGLEAQIRRIEDEVFADFSAELGVSSIREYEQDRLAQTKHRGEQRRLLSEQLSKLRNQLEYNRSRDLEKPLRKVRRKIAGANDSIAAKEAELAGIVEAQKAAAERAEALEREAAAKAAEVDEADARLKGYAKTRGSYVADRTKAQRQLAAVEMELEGLREQRAELLQKAVVDEVPLPSSGSGEGSGADDLPEELRARAPAEDEPRRRRMAAEVDRLGAELQRMQPNMKAATQFEAVTQRMRDTDSSVSEARQTTDDAVAQFNAVAAQRAERFMAAFQHVSDCIDGIYKELTRRNDSLGGNAYLSLENPKDPFLGGIKFNVMPVLKRFRDMEQLSGGEKTVAALALLFAIHSFQPSPFFVLDEVDAALDNANVQRVSSYIQRRSADLQCIVISLKDLFFEKADSLVGIYRDAASAGSRTATLDLRVFA